MKGSNCKYKLLSLLKLKVYLKNKILRQLRSCGLDRLLLLELKQSWRVNLTLSIDTLNFLLVENMEEHVIYKLIEQWVLIGYTIMQLLVYFILSFLLVLTQLPVWIIFIFTWWTLNPSSVFAAIKSFCLLGCFTVVSIRRIQHIKCEKSCTEHYVVIKQFHKYEMTTSITWWS